MAKIRKTASIENGIMQVLKILNEEEIQEAIGKGSSYLRKFLLKLATGRFENFLRCQL